MHETSAQGWCTGKTQRDGIDREAGGGIGKGNTCKSMADSCQCMAKTTKIYKNKIKKKNALVSSRFEKSKVQVKPGVIMATQNYKRNLFLNLYREGEKI